ncbi:MAG: DNA polymerase III subunit delta [Verrucomicrobiota bacterium]|nr:DNA polymerase III subunit delta [Verrucomicrobiota bacterium]
MASVCPSLPVALVCGDDEFAVKQRAKEIFQKWSDELGGMDHETIDGNVANAGEALAVLAKLREALQTLPFFGSGKVVWLQNCNFIGEERTASAAIVTETLGEIAQEFKKFDWQNVRLLISAGKVDKRKTFYKTLEKIGAVETFSGWSIDDKDWADQAEEWARKKLRTSQKDISDEAVAELVTCVGPHARILNNEVEKLILFVGKKTQIELDDVSTIVTRNKQARAFALGDALGDRDLPRLFRRLDEELWEARTDSKKSEIGLLYGLISKIRVLIFLKEMVQQGFLKPVSDFSRFKSQLQRVPADILPEDKRFNPLAMNPYILFKALPQTDRYSQVELIHAMDLLLRCNQQLVFSSLDQSLVLQQTLAQITQRAS